MARFTALVWNLEQFGVKFNGMTWPATYMESVRCKLVSIIASAVEADVIVIQELRRAGVLVLPALIGELAAARGGAWHFDWLPGAITANGDVQSFNELGFNPVANNEGYAVVWREGALAALAGPALSAGVDRTDYDAHRDRYISLVTRGQTLAFNHAEIPITFAGPSGELGFPPSTCPEVNTVRETREGVYRANDVIASRTQVRRPCTVTLAPTNGVEVPLVVYHAPVGQNGSRSDYYGSLIGFASAPLQNDSAVYAGDFNVVSGPAQRYLRERALALNYDLDTYFQRGSEGAIEPSPSVIHYANHDGTAFRTGEHVFGSARDYAFIRMDEREVSTLVINALDHLRTALDNAALRRTVETAADALHGLVGDVWVREVVEAYLNGDDLPGGADSQTALAIIYRDLVTDHLPVAIRYQV